MRFDSKGILKLTFSERLYCFLMVTLFISSICLIGYIICHTRLVYIS